MSTFVNTTTTPETITVKAKVGSQEYSLRVSKDAQDDLHKAVALVTERYQAVAASGKVTNPERIAVMVALNLAVEMNKAKQAPTQGFDFPNTDIATLRQHIGQILNK